MVPQWLYFYLLWYEYKRKESIFLIERVQQYIAQEETLHA